MNRHLKYNVILWILVLLYGCAAQKPAPVDRSYEEKPVETKKEISTTSLLSSTTLSST